MVQFIPDRLERPESEVPFFEDSSREKGIAGQGTTKSIQELQAEIRAAIGRLGGSVTAFIPGTFPFNPPRYGYRVQFGLGRAEGRFDITALPIRKETPARKEAALKQALYMTRNMLEAQYQASLLMPGSVPLVPYLIGPGGETVTEALLASGQLPQLQSGESAEVVVGELVE